MYLHELLHIQHRVKAVYLLDHFDASNSLESSLGIVKMIKIILEIVVTKWIKVMTLCFLLYPANPLSGYLFFLIHKVLRQYGM